MQFYVTIQTRVIKICILLLFSLLYFPLNTKAESAEEVIYNLNLPVIEINTVDGEEPTYRDTTHGPFTTITANDYVKGTMTVLLQNKILYESGMYKKNKSGMKLKIRGNTTASNTDNTAQKPMKIRLQQPIDLIGTLTGEAHTPDTDFLLLQARRVSTPISFMVAEMVGMEYVPAYTYVNVMLNGSYHGLYLLTESVKKGEGRVEIGDDGFLIEYDIYYWNEDYSFQTRIGDTYGGIFTIGYSFKYPDEDLNQPYVDEVAAYMNEVEDALSRHDSQEISKYIDYESFAKWLLVQDLIGNADVYGSNIYLYRNHFDSTSPYEEPLKLGPLWDLDCAFNIPSNKWTDIHNSYYFKKDLIRNYKFLEKYRELFWKIYPEIQNIVLKIRTKLSPYEQAINTSLTLTYRRFSPPLSKQMDLEYDDAETWFRRRAAWMRNSIISEMYDESISIYAEAKKIRADELFQVLIKGFEEESVFTFQLDIVRMDGVIMRSQMVDTLEFSVSLPSGVYLFVLNVPGHKRIFCRVVVG